MTTKFLFYFQIVCAIVFVTAQALKMFESIEGVSLGFFFCHGAFAFLNLSLSLVALKETERSTKDYVNKKQSVYIYMMWVVFLLIHLGIALVKKVGWKPIDTITLIVVFTGFLGIVIFSNYKKISLLNPWVKAVTAIFLKCVPQVTLAIVIYQYGKGGLSGIWILFGHITILTRILHLWVSTRNGWNKNTLASFVSEIFNEISWLVATGAFIIFK